MSPSRSKSGFAWDELTRAVAGRAGFQPAPYVLEGGSFTRGSAVSPFVQVFFQHVTNRQTAPAAFVGVHVDDFEREWRARLRRNGAAEAGEFPPFALHAMNVASLRPRPWATNSPDANEVAAVQEYLDRTFAYASQRLPSSLPSLMTAIEANRIADHTVEFYLGHPVKVRGFVEWLRRVQGVDVGDRVLPLLSDYTEPYDVNAMLGPPTD